ncbi:MAG: tRNA (guanosine(46)-N7)-methyltransferase TrmB, partial [Gemmatimonadales bacterium]
MSRDTDTGAAPWRNFHGRLKGKALRPSQEVYLSEDLGKLSPGAVDWDVNPDRQPIDLKYLFGDREVWFEIGFGGGEHMVHQAACNP